MPRVPLPTQRFIATTPGLSATRWLAFVLGSQPDVFVAHGHFPLDSVSKNKFQDEKGKGDIESLTTGTALAGYYQSRNVFDVFADYRKIQPAARAYGNIHSYTLDGLMRRVEGVRALDGISIVNVLRHPVSYIESHCSLVQSASQLSAPYRHYAVTVFPEALRQFPELFLMDCPDYRAFLNFAVSCLSVCDMQRDFAHSQFVHFTMESLTTDAGVLKSFCERLTGLAYPRESLERFIQEGPINRHRTAKASRNPSVIYSSWPEWKKDIAHIMIPDAVLESFAQQGYDIDMLRADAPSRSSRQSADCLADRLTSMDQHHALLSILSPKQESQPQLREGNYRGYNLVEFRGSVYALAQSLGPFDLTAARPDLLHQYQKQNKVIVAHSIEAAKESVRTITASEVSNPKPRARTDNPFREDKPSVHHNGLSSVIDRFIKRSKP